MTLHAFHYDTDVDLTPLNLAPKGTRADWYPWLETWARGWRICMPANYVTDLTSIPRRLWGIVGSPATGTYRKIAPVHDFLYRQFGLATRGQADAVLNEGMQFLQVGRWTRWEIYAGVRVGGHSSYKGGI